MIRLVEEKDFLQLANMRWEHKKEDDAIYGEDNIKGIESDEFIKEYINFLKTESVYKIFVMEKNKQIIATMFVTMIRKVPKPNKKESYIAYLTNVYTLKEYRNHYLKQNRCENIIVWPSDKAIEWYVRNEFKSENEILECEL